MLKAFGANLEVGGEMGRHITVSPGKDLKGQSITVACANEANSEDHFHYYWKSLVKYMYLDDIPRISMFSIEIDAHFCGRR